MERDRAWQTDATLVRSLHGGDAIVDWFGYVPDFHDAELLGLQIAPGVVNIRLHVFRMTNKTDADGCFVLDRHAAVTLRLEDVTALRLTGNSASIVSELRIRRLDPASKVPNEWLTCSGPEEGDYEIVMDTSYGLYGSIFAKRIALELEPPPEA